MFCYSTTTFIFFGASNIIGTNSWMVLDFYKSWFSYQKQHYLAKAREYIFSWSRLWRRNSTSIGWFRHRENCFRVTLYQLIILPQACLVWASFCGHKWKIFQKNGFKGRIIIHKLSETRRSQLFMTLLLLSAAVNKRRAIENWLSMRCARIFSSPSLVCERAETSCL